MTFNQYVYGKQLEVIYIENVIFFFRFTMGEFKVHHIRFCSYQPLAIHCIDYNHELNRVAVSRSVDMYMLSKGISFNTQIIDNLYKAFNPQIKINWYRYILYRYLWNTDISIWYVTMWNKVFISLAVYSSVM
jgi:hypothetical protein